MSAFRVILAFAVGFYLFFGAYKNYDWFFTGYKMRRAVKQIGRENTRRLYMVSGILFMIVAVVMIFV